MGSSAVKSSNSVFQNGYSNGYHHHHHSNQPPHNSIISLQATNFLADNVPFLTDVPANVVATPNLTPLSSSHGCFVGFDAPSPSSHHVFSLGKLGDTRFMSIFRFKVWWTTHWTGSNGRDLEHETQLLLLDKSSAPNHRPYVLILPIIESSFRASIQPSSDDHVAVCVESGSTHVTATSFRSVIYMQAGDDPYALVKSSVRAVQSHLGTFNLLDTKTPPPIVDKFGWCTWDAFYLTVHPAGVRDGVKGLVEGGTPPGMVLIDDGWQSICHDDDDPDDGQEGMNRTSAGEQMPCRLIKFEENFKFRDYVSTEEGHGKGMGAFVRDLKGEFGSVEYVYVWHALCGYWGGVRPGMKGIPPARMVRPELSPGLRMTMEDLAVDKIVNNGIGLVPPEMVTELYEGLHQHLESVGIDGVKVDVIHILEMLCEKYGGRVELAKAYFKALTDSVNKHFNGNGVIASMEHCNDFMLLGTQSISLGRVGDDFWCTDPSGDPNGTFWLQGCHMVHCAYNSLWMGNFIHPDWDMFQSTHPCAEFHAASRSVSGGPIYVSDSVGQHDFGLLKRLVLPDGTVLRCEYYALPTRDCLFEDPLHDGKTVLKIWNVNKFTGVLGAFNCQGGGWSPQARRNKCFSEYSRTLTCTARPTDIEWKNANNPHLSQRVVNTTFAVYLFKSKKLLILSNPSDGVDISLDPFTFELMTVSPVVNVGEVAEDQGYSTRFAPIGLANMLNTGGAVQSFGMDEGEKVVRVGVKGTGEMKAYASEKPRGCRIGGEDVEFEYGEGMVTVRVPWSGSSGRLSVVEYLF